jgi:pimeloyl-ACP methyl ester carboxylesterase
MLPQRFGHFDFRASMADSQSGESAMTRTGIGSLTAALLLAGCATGMNVQEVGSLHIGGKPVTLSGLPVREIVFTAGAPPFRSDPNGDFETEQMYAQYVKLAQPRARYPLLMIHGGGLSGVTWETKPDGKPGWQMFFLQAGHDVYVADAVERGRASWSRYPEVYKTEPVFRSKKEAWELFRIGAADSYQTEPARRKANAQTQFPTEAFDQFAKQGVPRWATNDAASQAAYNVLVQRICPCVIVVHSQGGNFAFNAALAAPELIKAIVAVEPSGAPDPAKADLAKLKGTPHLFVWGDYLDQHELWKKITPAVNRYRDGLRAAGVRADEIELPKMGIPGNSHMLMMDRNSDQVAAMVQRWLEERGLMK